MDSALSTAKIGGGTYALPLNTNSKILFYNVAMLEAANVKNFSLSNFDAVCEVAAEEGKIRTEDIARLKQFRANPSDESWIKG